MSPAAGGVINGVGLGAGVDEGARVGVNARVAVDAGVGNSVGCSTANVVVGIVVKTELLSDKLHADKMNPRIAGYLGRRIGHSPLDALTVRLS